MLSRFNFRSSGIPAKGVDTSSKSLSSREVLCPPEQGRFLVRCEHSGQACNQSRAGKHGLSVLMPLGHQNLKQGVACNRNYSIWITLECSSHILGHQESERTMGWPKNAWRSHVVGRDTQRHGVQDPHLKNSRLKPKTRTSVQPWSKSLIQSRRLLIVW